MVVRNVVLVAPSQKPDFSNPRFNQTYIYNYASVSLLDGVVNDHDRREDAVVFIGSQHVNNGSLLLLDIAEKMAEKIPKVKLLATDRFSSTSFRNHIIAEVKRRGLQNTLELIPNVKPHELMAVLNRATIGISPNLRVPQQIMGIHTKIFEYMAAALPVVVSDLPHQRGVVEATHAGMLAQPEDINSFVDAIASLVADRGRAVQLGGNGQQGFKDIYCYESQAQTLLAFYGQILAA